MLLQLNNLHLAADSVENLFRGDFEFLFPSILNERIRRKKNPNAKKQSVAAYILLNNILREYYNTTLCDLMFTENGKPYLENGPFFSVSHTEGYVCVAVSRYPIGVDIEQIRNFDNKVLDRYFSASEKRYISNKNSAQRFFKLWTLKEAIIKREDRTLSQIADIKLKILFGKPFYKKFNIHTEIYENCIISVCFSKKTGK